jgi:hypothetical protein
MMEYQEYIAQTEKASRLVQQGQLKEAADFLFQMLLSEISDLDKAAICVTVATLYDRMGNTGEALASYDKGIGYEQAYCRYEVTEKKVQYLSSMGKSADAVPIYEALIKQPYLTEAEKMRIRKTIQTLLGKSMAQWK